MLTMEKTMVEEHDIQQRLAAFIERETEYWDFWGAIRIVKSGRILWETSRGYACAEFGVKNNMSTRFLQFEWRPKNPSTLSPAL